jgi:hypothetical protein
MSGCVVCGKALSARNASGRCWICAKARRSDQACRSGCGARVDERNTTGFCKRCRPRASAEALRVLSGPDVGADSAPSWIHSEPAPAKDALEVTEDDRS